MLAISHQQQGISSDDRQECETQELWAMVRIQNLSYLVSGSVIDQDAVWLILGG